MRTFFKWLGLFIVVMVIGSLLTYVALSLKAAGWTLQVTLPEPFLWILHLLLFAGLLVCLLILSMIVLTILLVSFVTLLGKLRLMHDPQRRNRSLIEQLASGANGFASYATPLKEQLGVLEHADVLASSNHETIEEGIHLYFRNDPNLSEDMRWVKDIQPQPVLTITHPVYTTGTPLWSEPRRSLADCVIMLIWYTNIGAMIWLALHFVASRRDVSTSVYALQVVGCLAVMIGGVYIWRRICKRPLAANMQQEEDTNPLFHPFTATGKERCEYYLSKFSGGYAVVVYKKTPWRRKYVLTDLTVLKLPDLTPTD